MSSDSVLDKKVGDIVYSLKMEYCLCLCDLCGLVVGLLLVVWVGILLLVF